MEKTVGAHHSCIHAALTPTPDIQEPTPTTLMTAESLEPEPDFVPPDGTLDVLGRPRRLVARTTERYEAVQQRLAEGKSLAAIRRELRLDHSTVRRFARAQSLEELLVKATNRASKLDPYKPYLHQRWREGCHDVPRLHREIQGQGFIGDVQSVRRYFRPFKKPHSPLPKSPSAPLPPVRTLPKPRRVVRWITTTPDRLPEADVAELKEIRTGCPHLDLTVRHVRDFAAMMRDRNAEALPAWMDQVKADDLPALHRWSTASIATSTPSPPPSPLPGARARSKVTSREPSSSSAWASAARTYRFSANASFTADDRAVVTRSSTEPVIPQGCGHRIPQVLGGVCGRLSCG
ncbi:hypothetical protein [Streptomyces alanosinicus]|uniref:HTH IS21-type domain-containing protein n=1 Tax=Streptomyces alanosinicus TaxID=68171 RepID=A0A918YTC4_9ACTN|nr:hypothetical protein [Streptomyces alanosinicus]GHE14503.1 hypothetical protein GCM10010339_85440 [Streptomyces alanosinicus]